MSGLFGVALQGTVCAVLRYFPYEHDHETVPVENPSTNTKPIISSPGRGAGLTQVALSQVSHAFVMPKSSALPHLCLVLPAIHTAGDAE